MSVLLGPEIGTERLAREVLVLLIDNLPAALVAEDLKWVTLDSGLATKQGILPTVCTSDQVTSDHFYMGHRPSLIEANIDAYPNVSVMSYRANPSIDQGDQYDGFSVTVYIEAIVIDGPKDQQSPGFDREAEDLVNRKSQRMGEAIHQVMVDNQTLAGYSFQLDTPPTLLITDCFRRRELTSHGDDFYWQMVRLEYTFSKVSSL